MVLTVSFEVGLGRLVLGLPWERITEDYDVTRGGFLGFGLVFMLGSPLLAARLRGRKPASDEQLSPLPPVSQSRAGITAPPPPP